ncbi:RICIN domain-containing protein [Dactylosporangium aurantiacum]|uniref:RICIN domain-containing protein n=1 Tax=Dactylosporangium aurantiacum TaxID=35754 RepID=A0A9Q9IB50_9ACTN|nr:RICIN domain-containing protein [Dactylosporangium aurantiacum]MDG6101355.1 RICIN domain-containing protein [Dactylosporangium aurantiacum]UWZ52787.1 RICIN domain-containing protein [Dactylosporangium aurantiacum]
MTVYGGPRPTPPGAPAGAPPGAPRGAWPRITQDPLLFGAFAFLVVAVIAGLIFAFQGGGDGEGGPSLAEQQTAAPAGPPPSQAGSSAPAPPPSSAAASTAPPQGLLPAKPTLLRASHSGLCLQAAEGNGGAATQMPCDNNPTQVWMPQAVAGTQDVYAFVNTKDNRCLDVNGASKDNGAQVLQWDCHGGPNQQWRLQRDGDGFRFVSLNSGRCIGVDSGSPAPGAAARQWDCDNSANQRWQVPK